MKLVVQRVSQASVKVESETVGAIGQGLMVLFGVGEGDSAETTRWLVDKLLGLRIFPDDSGKMNLNICDIKGEVLVVSQFTLYANCDKGRRPSFIEAAEPIFAQKCYEKFVSEIREKLGIVQTGSFGAKMDVSLNNDGPVTLIIERSANEIS